jgi:hypothetical protein
MRYSSGSSRNALLIGFGRAGARFARACITIDPQGNRLRLAAVADRDPARLERLVGTGARTSLDYRDLLQSHYYDLVFLAANESQHFEIIRDLANFAPKIGRIICEKPLVVTASEVKAVRNLIGAEDVVVSYVERLSPVVESLRHHLNEARLRFILLNLVYVDQMGSSPFDVKFKGNDPHVDHIYPQSMLRSKLGLYSADINHLGNFRFVGAVDNIRKRAELPASYFTRLKGTGVDIAKHLLLDDVAKEPSKLLFDLATYTAFRDRRIERMWEILVATVNPEVSGAAS